MKTLSLAAAGALAVACALTTSVSASADIVHHQHQHRNHKPQQLKHVFHVHARKSLFDQAVQHVAKEPDVALDVWSVRSVSDEEEEEDPLVDAKLYATSASMKAFHSSVGGSSSAWTKTVKPSSKNHVKIRISKRTHGKDGRTVADSDDWTTEDENADAKEAGRIAKDREEVAACLNKTAGFLDKLNQQNKDNTSSLYTDSAFFDCFRPHDQVFAFFDALADQNSAFVTKFPSISTTFEGRAISAYRLSTTTTTTITPPQNKEPKKALYIQALIHAREWQAGASTFYTVAKLLDELRRGSQQQQIKAIFDEFDWYFVPIVNIDGYIYSATVDRYWRTNRDLTDTKGNAVAGVDLNRNFGPDEYFNLKPELIDDETNPGDKPLSEPSSAGIVKFLTSLENLSGIVDMHGFGGEVLRPFSNHAGEAPAPFGPQMKQLADGVAQAISKYTKKPYLSKTGAFLYEAYGCFDDGMYLQFNYTVPAITIEVEGEDFIAPQSSIRPVGKRIYHGLLRFAHEASSYQEMVESLNSADESGDDESEDDDDSESEESA